MNTNENTRDDRSEDVIELGVASVETAGGGGFGEVPGPGAPLIPGISEE